MKNFRKDEKNLTKGLKDIFPVNFTQLCIVLSFSTPLHTKS